MGTVKYDQLNKSELWALVRYYGLLLHERMGIRDGKQIAATADDLHQLALCINKLEQEEKR